MHLSRAIFIKFILKRNENEAISAVVFKGRAVKAGCATKLYNASLMFIFSKGQEKEVGEQLHYREYANLITSKKENTCPSLFFGSYRPPFEHHSLPSCPAYLCMPGREKKRILCPFLCQLLMIAAAAPQYPLGPEKCSFEKSPGRASRLPASIFDAVAHFAALFLRSHSTAPAEDWPHSPANYQAPAPAPAHCTPGTAPNREAIKGEANGAVLAFNEKSSSVLKHASCSKALVLVNCQVQTNHSARGRECEGFQFSHSPEEKKKKYHQKMIFSPNGNLFLQKYCTCAYMHAEIKLNWKYLLQAIYCSFVSICLVFIQCQR